MNPGPVKANSFFKKCALTGTLTLENTSDRELRRLLKTYLLLQLYLTDCKDKQKRSEETIIRLQFELFGVGQKSLDARFDLVAHLDGLC